MKSLNCPNGQCSLSGKSAVGHIIRYGFYTTKAGKRRRYQCQICGKTFSSTCGTPYYRLQHHRAPFDGVASLSVEGMNIRAAVRDGVMYGEPMPGPQSWKLAPERA